MRLTVVTLVAACALPDADDYRGPVVGSQGVQAVEMCRQNPSLPCGWVYHCSSGTEWCLPWADRAEVPKLKEACESLYGSCEVSADPRFSGTPVCYYHCPTGVGCNASQGCFCLTETVDAGVGP